MSRIELGPRDRRGVAWAIGRRARVRRTVLSGAAWVRVQALLMPRADAVSEPWRAARLKGAYDLAARLVDEADLAGEITPAEAASLRAALADRDLAGVLMQVPKLGEAARLRIEGALGRAPIEVVIEERPDEVVIEARVQGIPRGQENVMFVELESGDDGAVVELGSVATS